MNSSSELAAPGVKRPKNESIETLRGLVILLVVMGHVIGIDALGR